MLRPREMGFCGIKRNKQMRRRTREKVKCLVPSAWCLVRWVRRSREKVVGCWLLVVGWGMVKVYGGLAPSYPPPKASRSDGYSGALHNWGCDLQVAPVCTIRRDVDVAAPVGGGAR